GLRREDEIWRDSHATSERGPRLRAFQLRNRDALELGSLRDVPDGELAVTTYGEQSSAVRGKGHGAAKPVHREFTYDAAGHHVPESHVAAAIRGLGTVYTILHVKRQQRGHRRKRKPLTASIRRKTGDLLARPQVPDRNPAVTILANGHPLAIVRHAQCRNLVGKLAQREQGVALALLPKVTPFPTTQIGWELRVESRVGFGFRISGFEF